MATPSESLARLFRGIREPERDLESGLGAAIELPAIETTLSNADALAMQNQIGNVLNLPPPVPVNLPPPVAVNLRTARPQTRSDAGNIPPAPPEPTVTGNRATTEAEQSDNPTEQQNVARDAAVVSTEERDREAAAAEQAEARARHRERQEERMAELRRLHPCLNTPKPINVDLALAPKQLTPAQLAKMQPVDLKMFPKAKEVQMYVIEDKEKDKDPAATPAQPVQPIYAIPLHRNGNTIFVQFEPNRLTMTDGCVQSEGDGISEPLEFDFITTQWTTPEQRMASFVMTHARVTSRLKETLDNDEIRRAKASDSVHAQVEQIEKTIETCIAQFYRGEISHKDLSDQLDKKCEEVAKLASDKKTRESSTRRQYIIWAATIAGTIATASMVAYRLHQTDQSGS